jgi:hypothetical protein
MRRLALALALLAAPVAGQVPSAFELSSSVPLSAGQWSYRQTPGGSVAQHGANLQILCDRASRTVTIARLARVSAPGEPLGISTDSISRVLASTALGARDPLLDAIAFTRGRFVVTGGGGPRLVLPASAEAARSIEDCRN